MPTATVLLLSRDPSLVEACQGIIASIAELRAVVLRHSRDVESYLGHEDVALALLHVVDKQDSEDANHLLQTIASLRRPVATVILGEQHDPEQVLSLLRQGAADVLSRPLDLGRLAYLIDSLTVRARFASARPCPVPLAVPKPRKDPVFDLGSAVDDGLVEQVRMVAPQDTIVLLGGETGTGKTRMARLIHELSNRRGQPFLVVQCAALAANLMESEMFGHVRGAYTGADRDRSGKFAEAGRGTLLLDDIDSLPLALQAKLLRAIDERVFEPVGSNKSIPVQARLIAASNRALDQEVEAGRFRADLYYRLNVIAFYLPPLRERASTVPQLARGFLEEFAARNGRPVHAISPEAMSALESYTWPGNIRELRNVMERAVTLCPGSEIQLSDLPDGVRAAAWSAPSFAAWIEQSADDLAASRLKRLRGQAEAVHILEALRKHGNNRLRAAAELGISRMTLYNKLRKYGLIDIA